MELDRVNIPIVWPSKASWELSRNAKFRSLQTVSSNEEGRGRSSHWTTASITWLTSLDWQFFVYVISITVDWLQVTARGTIFGAIQKRITASLQGWLGRKPSRRPPNIPSLLFCKFNLPHEGRCIYFLIFWSISSILGLLTKCREKMTFLMACVKR
jgi:hypothetical protein